MGGKAIWRPLWNDGPPETDPFAHPDALRRFRVLGDVEALRRALDEPWEKWPSSCTPHKPRSSSAISLAPARVAGSAGTGKTIVALHRAVHLLTRCLIPGFDGAIFSVEWRDALWAEFYAEAPRRQGRSVERYSIVKRA
jgi:hypothetical protein